MAEIRVKSEHREEFLKGLAKDARLSLVDTDPRCYRFDVLVDQEDPNIIRTYEVYATRADHVEKHRNKPYFLALMKSAIEEKWFAVPPVIRFSHNVLPADAEWLRGS